MTDVMLGLAVATARAWARRVAGPGGQAMVEYALIAALVILVALLALVLLGNTVKNLYCNIQSGVSKAGN